MAEWLKAAVLKTARLARVSGVRIPLPPPWYYCKYLKLNRLRVHRVALIHEMSNNEFRIAGLRGSADGRKGQWLSLETIDTRSGVQGLG